MFIIASKFINIIIHKFIFLELQNLPEDICQRLPFTTSHD